MSAEGAAAAAVAAPVLAAPPVPPPAPPPAERTLVTRSDRGHVDITQTSFSKVRAGAAAGVGVGGRGRAVARAMSGRVGAPARICGHCGHEAMETVHRELMSARAARGCGCERARGGRRMPAPPVPAGASTAARALRARRRHILRRRACDTSDGQA
jgi:hypothetical protein